MLSKILFFFLVSVCICKNFDQSVRLKSAKCINNSTERHVINLCKIKVTRNSSFFLFNVTIKSPIDKPLFVKVTVFYKYGLIYRQIISVPEFEACFMMKNLQNTHPFMRAAFDSLGETIKPFLRGCPYQGRYDLSLYLNAAEFPSIFPSGMYKIVTHTRTPDNKFIEVIFQMEIVSSIKTSF